MTRLIDADELSNNIKSLPYRYLPVLEWVKEIYKLIDNAQTVEQVTVFTETIDEKAVADLKAELQSVIEARPQGEWVEKEETRASVSYYCSNCKREGIPITPFCPWCGARMKDIDVESKNEQ